MSTTTRTGSPPVGGKPSRYRRSRDVLFHVLFFGSVALGVVGLATLLIDILIDGLPWLDWDFVTNYPSRRAAQSGIKAALMGTVWVVGLTAVFCVPLGIATAIYLEEFARDTLFSRIIQVNIANLAGVPSIIYGLLGLAVFVQALALGRSVLAGALTMALLVLPIVIIASQEAIRAVPSSHRHAAFALGATRWQVVKGVVMPQAIPGIMSGIILGLSRAIGESAPMIAISALVFLTFIPTTPGDRFTVMPIQIYNWISLPQSDFRGLASAGIILLLIVLLTMNAAAIWLRNKFQRRSAE
jgi:phosphate transport system permease protein